MAFRFVAALLGLVLLVSPISVAAVTLGDPAPDFLAEDLQDGSVITLSSYSGKVILLTFFWTG